MIALDQWRAKARYFNHNGRRLAYWKSDTPAPGRTWLLLIHGFPTSSWDWSALWPRLENHFNLIAMDMLGFGLSDKPRDIDYTIAMQADFLEALIGEVKIEAVHLLVHDYGNTVTQELLARQLDGALSFDIQSICFLNGGLFPEQHRPRLIQKLGLTPFGPLLGALMSRKTLRKSFDEIFGEETKARDEEIDAHWALICANGGRKVFHKLLRYIPERTAHRERWVGALKESQLPMRLIDGGVDPVSGKHLFDYYRQFVPNADAVLFEEIGHYPQTEAPGRVFEAFLAFHENLGTVKP